MATVKDFSIEEKLVAVLTLQKIDSKIDDIKTLQGELPMEVRDLEDEIQGLQTRINNIDNEIDIINSVIAERTTTKSWFFELRSLPSSGILLIAGLIFASKPVRLPS